MLVGPRYLSTWYCTTRILGYRSIRLSQVPVFIYTDTPIYIMILFISTSQLRCIPGFPVFPEIQIWLAASEVIELILFVTLSQRFPTKFLTTVEHQTSYVQFSCNTLQSYPSRSADFWCYKCPLLAIVEANRKKQKQQKRVSRRCMIFDRLWYVIIWRMLLY